jgi:DNA-binding transcriptional LysR family regulator
MAIRLEHLRYLVTVADEGQITRAARALHVAQPALSQALAQLESELGIQLLERHARGVTVTPAGETFLAKARVALTAANDAAVTARALARAARGAMEVGFIGPPPLVHAPELFAAFVGAHPEAEVSFRELPFPHGSTASWLAELDVAFCHAPAVDPRVCVQAVRVEPRTVVAPRSHPLARRSELAVAELLDELFLGYDEAVQPAWAGFHSLDDHRGEPPPRVTDERASTPPEMLMLMASGRGITTVPASDAAIIRNVLRTVVAIPVRDAGPAVLSLVWHRDDANPLLDALVAFARDLTNGAGDGRLPTLAKPHRSPGASDRPIPGQPS